MPLLSILIGSKPGSLQVRESAQDHAQPPRLVVRTRCVLVADVVAIDADGKRETVVSGLDEDAAREVFFELTGRPWTRAEVER